MVEFYSSSHMAPNVARYGLPPRELFAPLIEVAAEGGHWYWLGDFNKRREAVFYWPNPLGDRLSAGVFVVCRMLVHYDVAPVPAGASVVSLCGLCSCICPQHWRTLTSADRAAIRERRKLLRLYKTDVD